jgi:cell division protein FtsB
MDLRLGRLGLGPSSKPSILVRPEERLRAVMEHGPRAEAFLTRWVERTRPVWSWLLREWRQLGTGAAALLIVGILVHAIVGANGMMIYRQKHDEMKALQMEVGRLQKENQAEAERIRQLKSNPAAIEKEAREHLHYSRKGEVVFVAPDSTKKPAVVHPENVK